MDVKHWPPIKNPGRYAGKELFFGSVTDPYQPLEAEYGRTRALLEQMRGSGCAVSIATKSDLVLRDLDLIRHVPQCPRLLVDQHAGRNPFAGIWTMPPPSRAASRPCVPSTRPACAPPASFRPSSPASRTCPPSFAASKTSAISSGWKTSTCAAGYRKTILDYIAARHPSLMPLYEAIYIHGDRGYWAALDGEVRAIAAAEGLPYVRGRRFHSPPPSRPRRWWSTTSSTRRSPLRQAREGAKRQK